MRRDRLGDWRANVGKGERKVGEPGLCLAVLRQGDDAHAFPDAFGCYIGKSDPIEVPEGLSWRDAVAEERARANALEDLLASLGYEVAYYDTVAELAEFDDVETLTVNGESWDLRGEP